MSTWLVVVIVLGAAGAVVFAVLGLPALKRSQVGAECAALRARLTELRSQGGDATEAAKVQAELDRCLSDLEAIGGEVDRTGERAASCESYQEQIEQEWAHYRSTAYEDAIKRNNTRQTILRLGEELARCLRDRLESGDPPEGVRRQAERAMRASEARARCFEDGASGCSRYGVNEATGEERAADERQRVTEPLQRVMRDAMPRAERERAEGGDWAEAAGQVTSLIDRKWAEYKGTPYTDALRRNNLRGEVLAEGRNLVSTYEGWLSAGVVPDKLAASAERAMRASEARAVCMEAGASGCGRFGWNEPPDDEKAADERAAVTFPLREVVRRARALVRDSRNVDAMVGITGAGTFGAGRLRGIA